MRVCALALYGGGLLAVALLSASPVTLCALLLALLAAGVLSKVSRRLIQTVCFSLPCIALIAAVNALLAHGGTTTLIHDFDLPLVGSTNITLEGLVYGAVVGLRGLVVVLISTLGFALVQPEELLLAMRRVSLRLGLTASVALRLMPVLLRDASRMHQAQRTRMQPAPRLAVARAVVSSALDRAVELAATLELRGYGLAQRPARERRRWSGREIQLATAGVVLACLAVAACINSWDQFQVYPQLAFTLGLLQVAIVIPVVACTLVPLLPGARR